MRTLIRRHAASAAKSSRSAGAAARHSAAADAPLQSGAFRSSVATPDDAGAAETIEQITVGSITAKSLSFLPRLAGTLNFRGVASGGSAAATSTKLGEYGAAVESEVPLDGAKDTYSYVHSPQTRRSVDGHGFAMLRIDVQAPGGEWSWTEDEDEAARRQRGTEATKEGGVSVELGYAGGAEGELAAHSVVESWGDGYGYASEKEQVSHAHALSPEALLAATEAEFSYSSGGTAGAAEVSTAADLAHMPSVPLAADVDLAAHRAARALMRTSLETAFLPLQRDDDGLFGDPAEASFPPPSTQFQQLLDAGASAEELPRVVLGPIVGEVTPYSCSILLEVDRIASVECVVVDAADGTTIRRALQLWPTQPRAFHFDELRPEHRCVGLLRAPFASSSHRCTALALTPAHFTFEPRFSLFSRFLSPPGTAFTSKACASAARALGRRGRCSTTKMPKTTAAPQSSPSRSRHIRCCRRLFGSSSSLATIRTPWQRRGSSTRKMRLQKIWRATGSARHDAPPLQVPATRCGAPSTTRSRRAIDATAQTCGGASRSSLVHLFRYRAFMITPELVYSSSAFEPIAPDSPILSYLRSPAQRAAAARDAPHRGAGCSAHRVSGRANVAPRNAPARVVRGARLRR